jgi:putative transposase
VVGAEAKRNATISLQNDFGVSERRACQLLMFPRSTKRYEPMKKDDSSFRDRIIYWADKKKRYGMPRIHQMLLREGLVINHKKTERIYREEDLAIRRKSKKKNYKSETRIPLHEPTECNEIWAMDFVSDQLSYGKPFRSLTIVDVFSKVSPSIEVDHSLTGLRVIRALEQAIVVAGSPKTICVDNGPEFICLALDQWAYERGIKLNFSRKGTPTDNAYIESFNGKFRDECLNMHWFLNIGMARSLIEQWRIEYNEERPHSSIGNLTPQEFFNREMEIKTYANAA